MFESFSKMDRATWVANANKELKGKIDANEMVYRVDNISVSPYLTHENTTSVRKLNMPKTKATALVNANTNSATLKAAEDGAQAIYTTLDDQTDIEMFCKGVYVDMEDWLIEDRSANQCMTSALSSRLTVDSPAKIININSDLMLKAEMTAQERARLAAVALKSGLIVMEIKQDFLAQIAEMRAFRYHYYALHKHELNDNKTLTIIAKCPHHTINIADRQSLIAINYMMMSAYMGGADYVVGLPYGQNDDAMARWSTNIQHILDLEAGIGYVQDPTAGAYMVEALTNAYIEWLERA